MRLRQILVNLLNNSVKFTDAGYVLVTISAVQSETDCLCFTFDIRIKDTGCGVQPDSQGKLFQMFSQVDSSTTRRFGGTGLGLALVKRFTEMMGGNITMESTGKDGEGSTFSLSLPVFLASTTPPPSCFSSYSQALFSEKTIVIIVDKCPISRRALQRRLQNKGFSSISTVRSLYDIQTAELSEFSEVLIFTNEDGTLDIPKLDLPRVAYVLMGSQDIPRNDSLELPPIFEFARKPLKDATICRCINSISLQLHHLEIGDESPRSPHPRTSKCRSNSFPVYPLDILVVEDNEVNQRVIKKMLTHIGYSAISIANNGQEALQIIEKAGIPDIVFMDVQMPVVDGIECTKILRKTYSEQWPYIVSMTADAFPEDRANCLNAGMDDFLTKPIRLEQLQGALEICYLTKQMKFETSTTTATSTLPSS